MSRSLVSVTISRHLARWLLLALVAGPDDSASREVRSERSPSGPSTRAFASQAKYDFTLPPRAVGGSSKSPKVERGTADEWIEDEAVLFPPVIQDQLRI